MPTGCTSFSLFRYPHAFLDGFSASYDPCRLSFWDMVRPQSPPLRESLCGLSMKDLPWGRYCARLLEEEMVAELLYSITLKGEDRMG